MRLLFDSGGFSVNFFFGNPFANKAKSWTDFCFQYFSKFPDLCVHIPECMEQRQYSYAGQLVLCWRNHIYRRDITQ